MIINLDTPIDFEANGSQYSGIQVFDFYSITDIFDSHIVTGHTQFGGIVLWEGEAYEAAGDYTQQQIEDRLRELLLAGPVFI